MFHTSYNDIHLRKAYTMSDRPKKNRKKHPIVELATTVAHATVMLPVIIVDGIFTAIND